VKSKTKRPYSCNTLFNSVNAVYLYVLVICKICITLHRHANASSRESQLSSRKFGAVPRAGATAAPLLAKMRLIQRQDSADNVNSWPGAAGIHIGRQTDLTNNNNHFRQPVIIIVRSVGLI